MVLFVWSGQEPELNLDLQTVSKSKGLTLARPYNLIVRILIAEHFFHLFEKAFFRFPGIGREVRRAF